MKTPNTFRFHALLFAFGTAALCSSANASGPPGPYPPEQTNGYGVAEERTCEVAIREAEANSQENANMQCYGPATLISDFSITTSPGGICYAQASAEYRCH